jgi:hypothetical protein
MLVNVNYIKQQGPRSNFHNGKLCLGKEFWFNPRLYSVNSKIIELHIIHIFLKISHIIIIYTYDL